MYIIWDQESEEGNHNHFMGCGPEVLFTLINFDSRSKAETSGACIMYSSVFFFLSLSLFTKSKQIDKNKRVLG